MTIHLITAGRLSNPQNWSDLWHHCYKSWEDYPYEIRMWHDEDIDQLLKEDDEEFFNILNTLPPVYKWDYVRYVILEKLGGAYFDMDVEIVNFSFFQKLDPFKFYFMEGTLGSYIENSIMISTAVPLYNNDLFHRLKTYIKRKILNNLEDCSTFNVIKYVGAYAISDWFSRYVLKTNFKFEILGEPHFASTTNEIVYTRHYQTSQWNSEII